MTKILTTVEADCVQILTSPDPVDKGGTVGATPLYRRRTERGLGK